MNDDALRELARQAGIAVQWTDNEGMRHDVAIGTLRAVLAALGLLHADARDIARAEAPRPLVTARVGDEIALPFHADEGALARVEFEAGGAIEARVFSRSGPKLRALSRSGYHRLFIGDREHGLAVAPRRCWSFEDAAPGARLFGLSAQIHALRRDGGFGHGDFGAVAELARAGARHGADALLMSPAHALFSGDVNHFTPYSPSSRLHHNALFGDPACVFSRERIGVIAARTGIEARAAELEKLALVDWPGAARARLEFMRALHEDFHLHEMRGVGDVSLATDFLRFWKEGGEALAHHALFEALHGECFRRDFKKWRWRDWPEPFRDPESPALRAFGVDHAQQVGFHVFLQWIAARSLARAQAEAMEAGMRIGLVADLAIGVNAGGSQCWSRPGDFLIGLSVGAPPDALAPRGQNWGLTTFSPRALSASGFAPWLATLRACLRHVGGLRIDHALGLARLWLVPDGADATEGAYLTYPLEDFLRLIALESTRHRAVVIGEDLGTAPYGLRERLAGSSLAGLSVLPFERDGASFKPPAWYQEGAVAMTSTHDTATTAGWWMGLDIERRAQCGQLPPGRTREDCVEERGRDRAALWEALIDSGATAYAAAPPPDDPTPVVDGAFRFVARAPSRLVLAPLEDVLGEAEQPNLPGTTDEHPNWRRRHAGPVSRLLDAPRAQERLRSLAARK